MRERIPGAIDAVVNIHTKEALAGRPDRGPFLSKLRVDPKIQTGFTLEETLAEMDAAGIDQAFLIAAKVGTLGHPACYHVPYELVAEAVARYPRRSVGRPIAIDAVACDFPELKLVGIHIGIPWTDEMIAMAWKHANVYIGADAHSPKYWPPSFVQYLNTYGQDKVIFGTDFPILRFERTVAEIEELNLRPRVMRKFFSENARRLYRLGPPQS